MDQIVARNGVDVTPHDTNANVFDALYVGGAGTVRIVARGGSTSNWTVPAGGQVPCNTVKVMSTGTTATNIVGMTL